MAAINQNIASFTVEVKSWQKAIKYT